MGHTPVCRILKNGLLVKLVSCHETISKTKLKAFKSSQNSLCDQGERIHEIFIPQRTVAGPTWSGPLADLVLQSYLRNTDTSTARKPFIQDVIRSSKRRAGTSSGLQNSMYQLFLCQL